MNYKMTAQFLPRVVRVCRHGRAGMALVLALAMIVLVTFAVVAFFSYATSNRRIDASRVNRIKSELLADTGIAHVTGTFLAEIASPTKSTTVTEDNISIFLPRTPSDGKPERKLSPGVAPTDDRFYTLIRQSVAGADSSASAHSTSEAARNGRKLNPKRWDAPSLVVENTSGEGFTAPNQLPNWIYVDRNNGVSSTPSADCIGRFAYNVYSVGGLFNANVAASPTGLSPAASALLSGGQESTDLTALLVKANPALTAIQARTAIDKLLTFRHPDFKTTITADQVAERTAGAANKGFLSVFNQNPISSADFTQNMFNTRQDLIHYTRTQNPELEPVLPFLTHASRSRTAPSWIPPVSNVLGKYNYANVPAVSVRSPQAGTVQHYTDNGQPVIREISPGKPFLQARFSLAKLAWLTPQGPSANLPSSHAQYHPGGTPEAIRACFGLHWNPLNERWDYVGPTGTIALSGIKSLEEVAAEATLREPNFFEMLKAAILDGGLGAHTDSKSYAPLEKTRSVVTDSGISTDPYPYDSNKDLHILKIGMNIVDCADHDNYPSVAAFEFAGEIVERSGIEDLPYFYLMQMLNLRRLDHSVGDTYHYLWSSLYWLPELWRPFRSATPSSQGPSDIRIDIAPGSVMTKVGYFENTFNFSLPITAAQQDLGNRPALVIPSAKYDSFLVTPGPVIDSTSPYRLGNVRPELLQPWSGSALPPPSTRDELVFSIYDFYDGGPFVRTNAGAKMPGVEVANLVVRIQYKTPGGIWKTYTTLGGEESNPEFAGINGVYDDASIPGIGRFPVFKHSIILAELRSNPPGSNLSRFIGPFLMPWDPSVSRFGAWFGKYRRSAGAPPTFKDVYEFKLAGITAKDDFKKVNQPFFDPLKPYPSDQFFRNDVRTEVIGNYPQFAGILDPDSISDLTQTSLPRVPDANIGYTRPDTSTLSNPYGNLSQADRRRVVLQRPFRSVAELGYVSRDIPWQTLNFINDRSADAGMLDFFSVHDEPEITSGRIGLADMPPAVAETLLSGAAQNPDGTTPLSVADVSRVAAAMKTHSFTNSFYRDEAGAGNTAFNAAGIPGILSTFSATDLSTTHKYRREAVVRALDETQTRTWNVLVDIVAQAGRFPPGVTPSANQFVVDGESRVWASVAIDRYTGEILLSQKEKVYE